MLDEESKKNGLDLIFDKIASASRAGEINRSKLREILMQVPNLDALNDGIQKVRYTQSPQCGIGNRIYIPKEDLLVILETYKVLLERQTPNYGEKTISIFSTRVLDGESDQNICYILAPEIEEEILRFRELDVA